MSGKPLRIGLCGVGTVGGGVVTALQRNAELIAERAGGGLTLAHVGLRRERPDLPLGDARLSSDVMDVARDPDIDVVVELIGGTTTAHALVKAALEAGKHVVTANKALIAEHGMALLALAEAQGVALRFEAAVAGGIPVIKSLREGLAGNRVRSIAGIINGTGNFILTEMAAKRREFDDVLAEAQALGYAEADPSFDVDGTDAAQKLAILASVAFGVPLTMEGLFMEGVDRVAPADLDYAAELGFRIKHLGIAREVGERLELRVHPALVTEAEQLARVDGVLNAVRIEGDAVGEVVLSGAGAGAEPTASAVLADLIDVARDVALGGAMTPSLGVPTTALRQREAIPSSEVVTPWYLRMVAIDRPGVMADIARLLSAQGVSIESLIQKAPDRGQERVDVVIITGPSSQGSLDGACEAITDLEHIEGDIARLRVADFH